MRSTLACLVLAGALMAPLSASSTLALASATARPVMADGCSLGPAFKLGRKLVYHYRVTSDAFDPDKPADTTPVRSTTIDAIIRFTTMGVDTSGSASFGVVFETLKIIAMTDSKESAVELNQTNKEAPAPENAPPLDTVSRALFASAIRIDVRSDGTVSAVEGLEDALKAATAAGPEGGRILGPFSPTIAPRTFATFFRIDSPPESQPRDYPKRSPGDTWDLVERASMSFAELIYTTTFKLDSCAAEDAAVSGKLVATVAPPKPEKEGAPAPKGDKPDPASPRAVIDQQADTLAVHWNPAKGALIKRARESSIALSAHLGELHKAMHRTRSKGLVELVTLTDP